MGLRTWIRSVFVISMTLLLGGCLPSGPEASGGLTITIYGFSIMKEPFEKEIYPAFRAKWRSEHGTDVGFVSSFAGSETVTNQILQGAPAEVAIVSIERDAQRLRANGAASGDPSEFPFNGIINKTPFVILVRRGNPKGIRDFADLAKPDIKVIHPDPVSSGGAQWSILAIYGSELKRTERETGKADPAAATRLLGAIWDNVISSPGSAREARTQFKLGQGDALVTYELEGLAMRQAGDPIEIVTPRATIFSEHPVVIIDRGMKPEKRLLVDEFVRFLWSDEAQRAFVKYDFRSVTNEALNAEQAKFAVISEPFDVEMFGGWDRAYPEIIENIFRDRVQRR